MGMGRVQFWKRYTENILLQIPEDGTRSSGSPGTRSNSWEFEKLLCLILSFNSIVSKSLWKHTGRKFFKNEINWVGGLIIMSESFFFLIATGVRGNLFKCKCSKKKKTKNGKKRKQNISQRRYCPLNCRAMCYFLLHLQNNRGRESNVLGAVHKRYSVTGSWGWWQVSGSLKRRNNERGNTLVPSFSLPPFTLTCTWELKPEGIFVPTEETLSISARFTSLYFTTTQFLLPWNSG